MIRLLVATRRVVDRMTRRVDSWNATLGEWLRRHGVEPSK